MHVAGIYNFLRLAEAQGWRTVFLGPAVSPEAFIGAVQETDADLVALSYRLTPENGESLLRTFRQAVEEAGLAGKRFCFGGTPLSSPGPAPWAGSSAPSTARSRWRR